MFSRLHSGLSAGLLATVLAIAPPAARAAVITFDDIPDFTSLTNQYAAQGIAFANTTVLLAGMSLNEFEFPPHSGTGVASDDGGALSLVFSSPMASVGAFFTYSTALTLSFYGAADELLATLSSAFGSNLALSGIAGSAPNEWLQFASPTGISRVTIAGDVLGGSFAMDDLTFTAAGSPQPVPVPEPAPASLLALGLVALALTRRQALRR